MLYFPLAVQSVYPFPEGNISLCTSLFCQTPDILDIIDETLRKERRQRHRFPGERSPLLYLTGFAEAVILTRKRQIRWPERGSTANG